MLVLCTGHQLTRSWQAFNNVGRVFTLLLLMYLNTRNKSIYRYNNEYTNVFKKVYKYIVLILFWGFMAVLTLNN